MFNIIWDRIRIDIQFPYLAVHIEKIDDETVTVVHQSTIRNFKFLEKQVGVSTNTKTQVHFKQEMFVKHVGPLRQNTSIQIGLTFELLTWLSIRINHSSRNIYLPNLKLLGQSVLELSVAQGVGDRLTYRHVQSFFQGEGGINIHILLWCIEF